MNKWKTRGLRFAAIAATTGAFTLGSMVPAGAAALDPKTGDWGVIIPGTKGPQSHAWVARVNALGGTVNTTLFGSHSPSIPGQPEGKAGLADLVNLSGGPVGLGAVKALYAKAITNKVGTSPDGADVASPGAAYAEAAGASVDIGLPYVKNPTGGLPLSPLHVHVDGIRFSAKSVPGKPVELEGKAANGYISILTPLGPQKIIDIPVEWPRDLGARIPEDKNVPAIALALTNEQVTTTNKGEPTLNAAGQWAFDPKASSGYVNAVHASVLGLNGADVVVAHAATLLDQPLIETPVIAPGFLAAGGLVAFAGVGLHLARKRRRAGVASA